MKNLLSPRFKVINPYPGSPFELNQILEIKVNDYGEAIYEGADSSGIERMYETEIRQYPHLFKPLPWHEDREPGDMPEYVKQVWTHDFGATKKETVTIMKVAYWDGSTAYEDNTEESRFVDASMIYTVTTPATFEDYNNYINSKA